MQIRFQTVLWLAASACSCHRGDPPTPAVPAAAAPAGAAPAAPPSPIAAVPPCRDSEDIPPTANALLGCDSNPRQALGDLRRELEASPPDSLDSKAVFARQPRTQRASVEHMMLGWDGGAPRGKRDRATLDALVAATLARLKAGEPFETVMNELTEDPSRQSGDALDVTPDAALAPRFKDLALRLDVGEVGVVTTGFWVHIVRRIR